MVICNNLLHENNNIKALSSKQNNAVCEHFEWVRWYPVAFAREKEVAVTAVIWGEVCMWIHSRPYFWVLSWNNALVFDIALKKESTRRLRRDDGERNGKYCSSDMVILIFMRWFQKDFRKFSLDRRKFRNGGEELVLYCLFHLRII